MAQELTAEVLRNVLAYDPDTGEFRWHNRQRRWGFVAGRPGRHGYIRIGLMGHRYFAHRLAWLYVVGEWPNGELDHRDCDPSNNRFANLRPATRSQQLANSRAGVKNTSGAKGVCWCRDRGKWQVQIKRDGKIAYHGRFESKDAAIAAYAENSRRLMGEYARAA